MSTTQRNSSNKKPVESTPVQYVVGMNHQEDKSDMDDMSWFGGASVSDSGHDSYVDINTTSNPYYANPTKVKLSDFRDANLYKESQGDDGFKVQHRKARKEYSNWVKHQRKAEGWEYFRVNKDDIPSYSSDPNPIVITPPEVREKMAAVLAESQAREAESAASMSAGLTNTRGSGHNRQGRLVAISSSKSKSIYDDDYEAKMYTFKMGQKIAQRRNELALTQEQLALKVGVDEKTISNVERGSLIAYNPSDILTRSLARELGWSGIKYEK